MPASGMRVAVLGAGHGGLALAAYLARRGAKVALWNRSPAPVAAVEAQGGIRLRTGDEEVLCPVRTATCDLGAALAGAQAVLVAVPAHAHRQVAERCAPHLRDGQAVLLVPGRTGGALEFALALAQSGCQAQVLLGETDTFPFASRRTGPAAAAIYGTKGAVLAAALPAAATGALLDHLHPLLPMLVPAASVLHTGLENVGAILHPAITLLNAGRIEGGPPFAFYAQGVTPGVAAVLAAADAERLAVARAYGVAARPLAQWVAQVYGHRAADVAQAVAGNPAYAGILAPVGLAHRYLYEDVPTGLVPLVELGRAAGVPCPTLAALATLAGAALGRDFWQEGRTLDRLGLAGLTPTQIRRRVASAGPVLPLVPIHTTAAAPARRAAAR